MVVGDVRLGHGSKLNDPEKSPQQTHLFSLATRSPSQNT
jgi:hypothetical protein